MSERCSRVTHRRVDAIDSYREELSRAGENSRLLRMCAAGAIAHAAMVERERADFFPCILDAGHSGDCKPAEVALAEALERAANHLETAIQMICGEEPNTDDDGYDDDEMNEREFVAEIRALLARVRGGDHG